MHKEQIQWSQILSLLSAPEPWKVLLLLIVKLLVLISIEVIHLWSYLVARAAHSRGWVVETKLSQEIYDEILECLRWLNSEKRPTTWNWAEIHRKIKAHKEDSQIFSSVNSNNLLFCRRAEGRQWNLEGQTEKSLEFLKQFFLYEAFNELGGFIAMRYEVPHHPTSKDFLSVQVAEFHHGIGEDTWFISNKSTAGPEH